MASQIKDYLPRGSSAQKLQWTAGQRETVTLSPVTLPTGRTLADFASFTLTAWEDPKYPRSGADAVAAAAPVEDGWTVSLTAAGSVSGSTVVFNLTGPSASGIKRYAVGVIGTLSAGGDIDLLPVTWLDVLPAAG